MKICVVGSGYVGLVTGACLADFGMDVTCVDKIPEKVESLCKGQIPIYEPGLDAVVEKNMSEGRLQFTTDLGNAIEEAQAVFIAVGTPPRADGSADMSFVQEVARSIRDHLNTYKVIITKSTVPVGTGQMIEGIVSEATSDAGFSVVSNPEFLREGSAIEDFVNPDRIVIGSREDRATQIMLDIYAPLRAKNVTFVVTDVETAEMIKYASNSFLATKISFINEVAELCEHVGANVDVVANGMGLDARIGPRFLAPGPGFGGSCFPKDTRAVAQMASEQNMTFSIVDAVLEANERTKRRMVTKIVDAFGGDVAGKTVAVLGLSFKPDTDDIRESAALPIVTALLEKGANVRVFDPAAMGACRKEMPDLDYRANAYDAAEGADGLVIVTEWNQFRALDPERLRELMNDTLIVDLRNLYERAKMAAAGFTYVSVGRPTLEPSSI